MCASKQIWSEIKLLYVCVDSSQHEKIHTYVRSFWHKHISKTFETQGADAPQKCEMLFFQFLHASNCFCDILMCFFFFFLDTFTNIFLFCTMSVGKHSLVEKKLKTDSSRMYFRQFGSANENDIEVSGWVKFIRGHMWARFHVINCEHYREGWCLHKSNICKKKKYWLT